MTRIALIGGIYSNYHALVATLADIARRGSDATYFLGDLGAFGPFPDRIPDLLIDRGIPGIQGNYEESLSTEADDCHCGYTDPRDNFYARISYDYTAKKTSDPHKKWMGTLPKSVRLEVGAVRVLLSHGSPRKINEFLWRSTSPDPFLEKLCDDYEADVVVCTHSGLHWHKRLSGNRHVVNAGVIGRPANDGKTNVWYTMLTIAGSQADVECIPIDYDHRALAREMREEKLPNEFIETIETGWWTTCLEILPARERASGRF
ncbi:MAG: metallophosphoesterase [Acidobacteriota bacterium]|nr:metallophosphoesterase [Acidobacteriota bacterium]